jgi:hypothetical protein
LNQTLGAGIAEAPQGFYITTAINYTNGPAHMGHAYEAATTDVIARFQRLKGTHPTYFVTGADEHGQKIANTAADQGKEPIDICNTVSFFFLRFSVVIWDGKIAWLACFVEMGAIMILVFKSYYDHRSLHAIIVASHLNLHFLLLPFSIVVCDWLSSTQSTNLGIQR